MAYARSDPSKEWGNWRRVPYLIRAIELEREPLDTSRSPRALECHEPPHARQNPTEQTPERWWDADFGSPYSSAEVARRANRLVILGDRAQRSRM